MFDGIIRTLNDVRFIPSMCKNLISLGMLVEKGYTFSAKRNVLCVMASDKVILKDRHRRNLYVLEGSTICEEAHVTASQEEIAQLWHRRLGHMSEKGMEVLRTQNLLFDLKSSKLDFCEHCVFGKHKRSAFGIGIHRSTDVLEYAHSDVWGKSPIPSHSRSEYYVSFIDDYLRYVWIIEGRGEAQAPNIDNGESHPSGVERVISHDIDHDAPQGDFQAIAEDVLEPEEHVEE
ncbi:hypothetical protein R1flu_013331 [Riccia fluitans]|uniref:GAG-pre-integrase domain-containing protein n=1 Tax=Riccia fluitans TaxID=41844 RepID=A0ABD1YDQ1_9MARC